MRILDALWIAATYNTFTTIFFGLLVLWGIHVVVKTTVRIVTHFLSKTDWYKAYSKHEEAVRWNYRKQAVVALLNLGYRIDYTGRGLWVRGENGRPLDWEFHRRNPLDRGRRQHYLNAFSGLSSGERVNLVLSIDLPPGFENKQAAWFDGDQPDSWTIRRKPSKAA